MHDTFERTQTHHPVRTEQHSNRTIYELRHAVADAEMQLHLLKYPPSAEHPDQLCQPKQFYDPDELLINIHPNFSGTGVPNANSKAKAE